MFKGWLVVGLMMSGCLPVIAQRPDLAGVILTTPLSSYLELTSSQLAQLNLNLRDFDHLISGRQQRIYQVQSEIREETSKNPLNPAALGIRYAEIESICRNAQDEAAATQKRNLALLTDSQLAKLKALEGVPKLLPIINEGVSAGLLKSTPSPPSAGVIIPVFNPSNGLSSIYGLLGRSARTLSGCQQSAVFTFDKIPAQLN